MHRADKKRPLSGSSHRLLSMPRTIAPGIVAITMAAATLLSGACFFGSKTNLCEVSGRRCNPGQVCAANQDICIDIGGCGDGKADLEAGEVCDDGNVEPGDGCSADCKSNETCGNGIEDTIDPDNPKETCDDGNKDSGDGCNADCLEELCGDGIYNPTSNEQCDTAGDTQACNGPGTQPAAKDHPACKIPRCGDNYLNEKFTPFGASEPETCDSSQGINTENCNGNNGGSEGPGSCRKPFCGDGYTNTAFKPANEPEQCDNLGGHDSNACNGNDDIDGNGTPDQGSCRAPSCGDSYTNEQFKPPGADTAEECDTGVDSQTCNGPITAESNPSRKVQCHTAKCGDNYVNPMHRPTGSSEVEECDAGAADTATCNGNGGDGPGRCRAPRCGDKYVNGAFSSSGNGPTEKCDDGNTANDDACIDCQPATCGDGFIWQDKEACDPGSPSGAQACPDGKLCTTPTGKVEPGCRCI